MRVRGICLGLMLAWAMGVLVGLPEAIARATGTAQGAVLEMAAVAMVILMSFSKFWGRLPLAPREKVFAAAYAAIFLPGSLFLLFHAWIPR